MEHLEELVEFYPKHIDKEDKHFFIPCMAYFSEAEQADLLARMQEFDRMLIHEKYRGRGGGHGAAAGLQDLSLKVGTARRCRATHVRLMRVGKGVRGEGRDEFLALPPIFRSGALAPDRKLCYYSSMVYLVGAGPGDPGLITAKGLALLRRAQVVVYDQLASPELLKEAPAEAELIYVGKKAGAHAVPQEGINDLLVAKARAGLTVVRLKGGDPFVFGRGGEEAEELAAAGIPFEIVPGVTAAVAVPAYAGIPVTHRRYTTLVTFITGHEDPTKEASTIPWEALGQNPGTLVFLMGVKNLPEICRRLVEEGRDPETPAAVIESGTTLAQRTVTGTLADIAQAAREADIKPPAILVVGGVVELAETLKWWETRPLWGKTVVVTRSRQQATAWWNCWARPGPAAWRCPPSRSARRMILRPWIRPCRICRAMTGSSSPAPTGCRPSWTGSFIGTGCPGPGGRPTRRHRPGHGPGLAGFQPGGRCGAGHLPGRGAAGSPGARIVGRDADPPGPGRAGPGRAARRAGPSWGSNSTWSRCITPCRP